MYSLSLGFLSVIFIDTRFVIWLRLFSFLDIFFSHVTAHRMQIMERISIGAKKLNAINVTPL